MIDALLGAQLAVVAELIGFASKTGIDSALAVEIVAATSVCSPAARASAGAMLAGAFTPAFPMEFVVKDLGLVQQAASTASAEVPVCAAIRAVYETGVSKGFGEDNVTGIVQLYETKA